MRRLNVVAHGWRPLTIRPSLSKDVRWKHLVPKTKTSTSHLRFCSCTASAPAAPAPAPEPSTSTEQNTSSQPQPNPNDHRSIGAAQDLFATSVYSPGSPLFQPNGTHILNKLIAFLRAQYKQYGFREVLTPNVYKQSLWEVSGHWQNYKDDMYEVRGRTEEAPALNPAPTPAETETGIDNESPTSGGEDEAYGLKPMNCPGHCLLFGKQKHSYRDLPVRYADFSPLHRNEVSGSLTGLTRVRRFHQDDGHIFCRPQQIGEEIRRALKFSDTVLRTFGLGGDYRLVLSTRPEKDFIGSIELWDTAEQQLRQALDGSGRDWEINAGDGAFYGPKIDLQIPDKQGKYHQLSTIQLDMNLPERFGLEYTVPEGMEDYNPLTPGRATPVLIHRAIFGSLERFFALLIERYNGRWPFWLSPRQAIILTVNQDEKLLQAADDAAAVMSGCKPITSSSSSGDGDTDDVPLYPLQATFNIDVDKSARSVSKKIREAQVMKYNLIIVMGPKNLEDGTVNIDISGQTFGKEFEDIKQFLQGVTCTDAAILMKRGRLDAKMKMKIGDVYDWMVELEKKFQ